MAAGNQTDEGGNQTDEEWLEAEADARLQCRFITSSAQHGALITARPARRGAPVQVHHLARSARRRAPVQVHHLGMVVQHLLEDEIL